jgi:hypothetical protein
LKQQKAPSNIAWKFQTIKSYLTLVFLMASTSGISSTYKFETARLKSTAGAGVGSLLLDESTLLNPAPMAFFNIASFYIQRSDQKTTSRENGINKSLNDSEHTGFIASDSKGILKGSVSYQRYKGESFSRKRWAVALASPVGKSSAIGINFRKTKERKLGADSEYSQIIFGLSHVLDESFSFGLVVIDPFKKGFTAQKGTMGLQYSYKNLISLLFDLGADLKDDVETSYSYKSALQIKVFEDFYLRMGIFKDKKLSEKGNGIGVGWVQPKLSIDFALKNTNTEAEKEEFEFKKSIKETSFSLSYRF